MFDFRRITLFCLEKRLSKQKMTLFSKNWGACPPLATPMPETYFCEKIPADFTVSWDFQKIFQLSIHARITHCESYESQVFVKHIFVNKFCRTSQFHEFFKNISTFCPCWCLLAGWLSHLQNSLQSELVSVENATNLHAICISPPV